MKDRVIVYGSATNICLDFNEKYVYLFRHGWAAKQLKFVDIALPFDKITHIECIKNTTSSAGKYVFIMEGKRVLAEDPRFENHAAEFSANENMYRFLEQGISRIAKENPHIQLVTSPVDVPTEKNQQVYATHETFKGLLDRCSKDNTDILKGASFSMGAAIIVLLISLGLLGWAIVSLFDSMSALTG